MHRHDDTPSVTPFGVPPPSEREARVVLRAANTNQSIASGNRTFAVGYATVVRTPLNNNLVHKSLAVKVYKWLKHLCQLGLYNVTIQF